MKLYNSLTNSLEDFSPFKESKVSLYVCGITPYDTTHLGHAFTYLAFDALIRYLQYQNLTVTYTQNVTDINDRDNDILKRAQEKHTTWKELSKYWTGIFLTDMEKLNWIKPTNYLYASEQIDSMTSLIQKIITNGFGYEVTGSVYLDVSKRNDFGKLSKFSPEKMLQVANEFEEDTGNPDKRNPLDITLWRATDKDQPSHIPVFKSPFGPGRPGWHIECSAMSISSLGEQIDIHGGGIDLIYPHHEAEIAQSESATNKIPFAKQWMHTAPVSFEGKKMSKSLGNLVLVRELLEKYSPNAIRYLLLSHHYREGWEYKQEDLDVAQKEIDMLTPLMSKTPSVMEKQAFIDAMNNDLDTKKALTIPSMLPVLGFI